MSLPVIAIVGRPNVGKSSLFNALTRQRTSIVDPTAGVTRDRVTTFSDVDEVYFELVDTGGYGIVDRDDLGAHVERQIKYAIDQAHLILLIVDVREGLTPLDREIADLLRSHKAADRVQLIANKVDNQHLEVETGEFARLGFGDPCLASAIHIRGIREIRQRIKAAVSGLDNERPVDPVMKIALIGKRNTGKSTFVNALAGEPRVIVSEIPGTTRDSIDVRIEKDGRTILVIDTAGVRKRNKMTENIEFYANSRAIQAVHRADVVLLLTDATVPVGQVDKRLAHLIVMEHKPCVLVVNKWDLAKGRADAEDYGSYLTRVLPQVSYAPVSFTSAVTGRNVYSTIDLATELFKQSQIRVGTGQLNQALQSALSAHAPKGKRNRKAPKFFYATQVATQPPTIVLFVDKLNLVTVNYERFLRNRFRETLSFEEIPIRLVFRARRERNSVRSMGRPRDGVLP